MAAIADWNMVYLAEAIATLRKWGEDIPEAIVAHIVLLGWKHICLIGDYHNEHLRNEHVRAILLV